MAVRDIIQAAAGVSTGPTVIGQAFGGGYYAGKISTTGNGVATHYLIVAPRASGQFEGKQGKTSNTATAGTSSLINGPTNSANMNNASHPAAQFCEGLSIGGYTDWYLPAKNELEVCYYFLKPGTASNSVGAGSNANAVSPEPISTGYTTTIPGQAYPSAFWLGNSEAFSEAFYWSSTEGSSTTQWGQSFTDGYQNNNPKTNAYYVRAVRRIPV